MIRMQGKPPSAWLSISAATRTALQLIRRPSDTPAEAYLAYAKRHHIRNVLYLTGTGDQITAYDTEHDRTDTIAYTDYIPKACITPFMKEPD